MIKKDFQALEYNYRSSRPVRTLFSLLNRPWHIHAAMLLLLILKHSPLWAMPFLVARIINSITDPHTYSRDSLVWYFTAMALLVSQNVLTHTGFITLLSNAVRDMERTLRNALVTRLQQLSIAYHDRTETGRLQTKVLRDVEQVQNFCMLAGEGGSLSVFSAIFAFTVTAVREPRLLIFFLLAVPLTAGLRSLFERQIKERNTAFRTEIEQMSAGVTEMINMIPVVRAHGLEEVAVTRLGSRFDAVIQKGRRLDRINALFGSTAWATFQMSVVIGLALLSWFCIKGWIPVGDIVLYQTLFSSLVMSVSQLLNIYPQLARGFESIRSIGEVLECPDLEQNEGRVQVVRIEGHVEFRDTRFIYENSDEPAIDGLSLTVAPGESIALVGPSGGGKSTLMQLLIGFRRPQQGQVLLDGRDMEELDMRSVRRLISVVPQETLLFSGSIKENILYGLRDIDDVAFRRVLEAACLTELVDRLPEGADTLIGEDGSMLSGGQRQRIAIARALARNPRILVLDEATSALDVESEQKVQTAIDHALQNRTTFIVAHRLSTIRKATRIAVLRDGQIAECGTWQELMDKKGFFYDMQQLQNEPQKD